MKVRKVLPRCVGCGAIAEDENGNTVPCNCKRDKKSTVIDWPTVGPELLEALENVMELTDGIFCNFEEGTPAHHYVELARSAIRKASGEES